MSKGKILIVEDEYVVAENLKVELESMDYEVLDLVSSGEEAMESARVARPDLALMDIKLSGEMDGLETATLLKRELDVPVVFLTAFADEDLLERAKPAEPLGYLIKPYDRRGFRASLEVAHYKARTERLLKESEARFRSMFENSPMAYLALDELERCLDFNSELCELLGYGSEELKGKDFIELWSPAMRDAYSERFTGGREHQKIQVELELARKDNSLLTVLLDGRIQRDAEGKFLKMHCILHNITERKRLEEERQRAEQALWKQYELMRVLLSAIPAYVYIKNTDLVYILGNKRFSELSGIPEDEIPGKTDYDFFSKTDADNFRRNDAEILASGTERLTYEMQGQSAEGKTVWFSTSKCPFYDPSGEVAGLVGICIDITKQKQLEQERFQLAEKLQQSEKAESLSRMAGAIAHHFNNLLGVILGSLELSLIDLPSKPGLLQNIETAVKASNRATELTRLILAYLGQSVGKKKPIQLSETLRQALSLVRAALPANLRVNTELPSGGPMIRADAVQIEQILTNLMVNAAEALGNQEGEITVALNTVSGGDIRATRFYPVEWKPKEQTYARVTVSDTGCGMDTETMERVFDPFYSTKFMGRGMGLSVALGLVRTHEGAFTLESEVGLGSTFKIFLPAIEQEAPGHHPSRALKLDTAIEHGLILLVDDEPMVRQMCTAMLEVLGYKVMAAADGVEAVAIFSQHKQDIRCVLLDLVMPRMNGWETLAALRSLRPGVPAVLVSGYDQAEAMQGDHTEQPGCFLHKPYTMADLQAVLAKALE